MEATLTRIDMLFAESGSELASGGRGHAALAVSDAVEDLNFMAAEIPGHLHDKMLDLQGDVRGYYRIWIVVTWITSLAAAMLDRADAAPLLSLGVPPACER